MPQSQALRQIKDRKTRQLGGFLCSVALELQSSRGRRDSVCSESERAAPAISGNRNRKTILHGAELGHRLVVDFKVGVNVLNVVVVFKRRHQFED